MEPVLLPTIPVIARTGGFADAPVAGIRAAQVAATMTGIKKRGRTTTTSLTPRDNAEPGGVPTYP
jgi:hypothetical protein